MDFYFGPTGQKPVSKDGITVKDGLAFVDAYNGGNTYTPAESPYGYGVHIVKGPRKYFQGANANYDDRLREWKGHDAYREAMIRNVGSFHVRQATMPQISAFLSELYDKPTECLQVCEGCNLSNGFPFLIFVTRDAE